MRARFLASGRAGRDAHPTREGHSGLLVHFHLESNGASAGGGESAGEGPANCAGRAHHRFYNHHACQVVRQGSVAGAEEGGEGRRGIEENHVTERCSGVVRVGDRVGECLARQDGCFVDRFSESEAGGGRVADGCDVGVDRAGGEDRVGVGVGVTGGDGDRIARIERRVYRPVIRRTNSIVRQGGEKRQWRVRAARPCRRVCSRRRIALESARRKSLHRASASGSAGR